MVIDEKQSENINEMEDEVAPVIDTDVMPVDESNIEPPPAIMVKYSFIIEYFTVFRIIRNKKQH